MSEAAAPAAAPAAASPEAAAPAATGAAATPATPTPAPAAPATAPATAPPAPATQDISTLPEWAQQMIRGAQQQTPAPQAPPAPVTPPAPPAPAPTEGDVNRLPRWAQQAVTDGQGATQQLALQTAIIAAAPAAGADVARLLDSQAAMRALSAVDPTDHAAVQQAITTVIAAHGHLAAGTAAPVRAGVEFTSSGAGEITPAQFAAMTYQQRTDLYQSDPDTYRRLAGA
ncbi:hypothetical protein [Streptomyces griseoloalbus]|uniref:Uncharacterized protein n=1 Tax=Streptomyces griseoloalbus TaxID=67303 RepID=A0A7W8FBM7_9ACTN|nr:hypothetical protein [Streptomyces albaduncus]MBB5128450.1 hypothetical protein [Streptomyces albaduncus]GGW67971.1 hypothetical protein GCM10010340_52620 [Streptomyces albaduncus]